MRCLRRGCVPQRLMSLGRCWSPSPLTLRKDSWKREQMWGKDKSRKWQGGRMDPQARCGAGNQGAKG